MFENTAVVFLSLTLELSHYNMAQLVSEEDYFHAMTERNECNFENALNWHIFYRTLKILLYSGYMVIFILATFFEGFFIHTVHVLGFL